MKHVFASEEELTAIIQAAVRSVLKEELTSMQPARQVSIKDDYLSRKQVSEMLGISLPTLGDYVKTGKLKAYRIGRRVRFKRSEVESALTIIQTGLPNSHNNHTTKRIGVKTGENNNKKIAKFIQSGPSENELEEEKANPLNWIR
jgi:excisionase family DNA binding protein